MHDLLLEKVRARSVEFKTLLPTKDDAGQYVTGLLALLFARSHGVGQDRSAAWLDELAASQKALTTLLEPFAHGQAAALSEKFYTTELPQIYDVLWQDAEAAYAGDPAAQNLQEVVLAYPGFFGVAVYRIAHYFHSLGIATLPRLFSEHAHEKTGIDIHPAAKIGRSFFMDHGTGIVIGGTSVIADNVKIYQGVTLGALSVDKSLATTKRHPTIEEGVVIYAGATILGGATVIGKNSVIGGNTWIVESVAPYSVVYNKSSVRVRPSREVTTEIDFSI
ncbi:serine O-acetyltransferase EpsC [Turneriella parva]|uniref:Transferase hexapeptide repeat containing protein n=1 Tax=Turneriella parva (strain ATCC BAA-1111 / DSM 21527 / NCTC 11395 / H) TaxID=869212 RepID=I4B174_TURPD|nr:serine O-acetyltransferase EpsC [Turneriella parva]AFM11031.1 transferase hexapeptide repeat containing protein [Turneriella parva DSM 21527]